MAGPHADGRGGWHRWAAGIGEGVWRCLLSPSKVMFTGPTGGHVLLRAPFHLSSGYVRGVHTPEWNGVLGEGLTRHTVSLAVVSKQVESRGARTGRGGWNRGAQGLSPEACLYLEFRSRVWQIRREKGLGGWGRREC